MQKRASSPLPSCFFLPATDGDGPRAVGSTSAPTPLGVPGAGVSDGGGADAVPGARAGHAGEGPRPPPRAGTLEPCGRREG